MLKIQFVLEHVLTAQRGEEVQLYSFFYLGAGLGAVYQRQESADLFREGLDTRSAVGWLDRRPVWTDSEAFIPLHRV
jgi:hypothetical protein